MPYFFGVHLLQLFIHLKSAFSCVSRWLICTLAVRFFQNALNADLKIKSVGLFSVQGVSIQFHPQHTLVGHTFVYMTFM
uniref:Secreted protein n=1 Tax=Amphilophus citrinellus TaxID=61819 RepID=A0A3Q0RHX0_AMPCI